MVFLLRGLFQQEPLSAYREMDSITWRRGVGRVGGEYGEALD